MSGLGIVRVIHINVLRRVASAVNFTDKQLALPTRRPFYEFGRAGIARFKTISHEPLALVLSEFHILSLLRKGRIVVDKGTLLFRG